MERVDINQDQHSIPMYDIAVGDITESYTAYLAAATDTTLTVPANAKFAFISSSDFVMVWKDAVITLPVLAAGFGNAAGTINPQCIPVEAGEVLHFNAPNSAYVTVLFKRP